MFDSTDLVSLIQSYYEYRKLTQPTTLEAVAWAVTELGEAMDHALMLSGDWVRNNPDDHMATTEALCEELGDVIMMAIVAGITIGFDPISCLVCKINRKMK